MNMRNTEQETHDDVAYTRTKAWKKYGRFFLYSLATCLVLCLMALGAAALLLYKDPVAVSKKISQEIYARTGIELQFSHLDVAFVPMPALIFDSVNVHHENLHVTIPELAISPSWYHLIQGAVVIENVRLKNPYLRVLALGDAPQDGALSAEDPSPTKLLAPTRIRSAEDLRTLLSERAIVFSPLLRHGRVEVFNATVDIAGEGAFAPVALHGVHMRLASWEESVRAAVNDDDDENAQVASTQAAAQRLRLVHLSAALSLQEVRIGDDDAANLHDLRMSTRMTFREHKPTAMGEAASDRQDDGRTKGQDESANTPFVLHDARIELGTQVDVKNVLKEAEMTCDIAITPFAAHDAPIVSASWATSGDILWENASIAFALDGDAHTQSLTNITLENVKIALEKDRLILNGLIKDALHAPRIQGVLDIARVSLTQWFGFARNLPPGLRYSLDEITGSLSFTLDAHSLDVPFIDAHAADAHFQGRGGVASWDDIVIFLDVTAPHVALIKAFAEAEGATVPEVTFHHGPLTPIPGTPEARGMAGPDISYDINIGADAVDVWSLRVGHVRFRCLPSADVKKGANAQDKTLAKLPKGTPETAVLLGFRVGDLYGGRAQGDLWLYHLLTKEGVHKDTAYTLHAQVRKVGLEHVLSRFRDVEGLQPVGGSLSADTKLTARGQDLRTFFVTQKGTLNAKLEKGFFSDEKKKNFFFDTLSLDAGVSAVDVAGGAKAGASPPDLDSIPAILRYTGQWNVSLKAKDLQTSAKLTGAIDFTDTTYTELIFDHLRGEMGAIISGETSPLGIALSPSVHGAFSLNTQKGVFRVHSADMRLPELNNSVVTGSATLDFAQDMRFIADIETRIKSLSAFLQSVFQEKTQEHLLASPQNVRLKTQINFTKKELRFDAVSGAWGEELEFQGKIRKILGENSHWDFTLQGTMFDWDTMFPSNKNADIASTANSPPWSWTWLEDVNAQGTLSLQMFRISNIAFTDIHLPLRASAGMLDCKGTTFALYGGNGTVDFLGKTEKNALNIQGGLVVQGMQLPLMSASQQLPTLIGGTGNAWFSVQGPLRRADDIINALEGTWRIKLKDGYLQERNEDGSLKKDMTAFDAVEDAGTFSKGILVSNNFRVTGPDINIHGNGSVNFMKKTLDVRWNVSASGFTNIPVRFHGNLDKPERDISAGTVILQAILGVFNVFGSFISGFFELFR